MTLEQLRPYVSFALNPLINSIKNLNISPNILSITALVFAILASLSFYFGHRTLLLLAGFLVAISGILDVMDGTLARTTGRSNSRGDLLDHMIDRYGDLFILAGIFFGPYAPWNWGVVALIGTSLTSHLGTQARVFGLPRNRGGILSRADRITAITVATFANYFFPFKIWDYYILGWTMIGIAIIANLTAIQRFFQIWDRL